MKQQPGYDNLVDGVVIEARYQSHTWDSRVVGHPTIGHAQSKTPDDCIHKAKSKVVSHCKAINAQARSKSQKQPYDTDLMERKLKGQPDVSGITYTDTHPIPWAAWEFKKGHD